MCRMLLVDVEYQTGAPVVNSLPLGSGCLQRPLIRPPGGEPGVVLWREDLRGPAWGRSFSPPPGGARLPVLSCFTILHSISWCWAPGHGQRGLPLLPLQPGLAWRPLRPGSLTHVLQTLHSHQPLPCSPLDSSVQLLSDCRFIILYVKLALFEFLCGFCLLIRTRLIHYVTRKIKGFMNFLLRFY